MTGADRPLRVLLFSPLAGRDPLSGDTSYTDALLRDPPPGVAYTTYADAIADGSIEVLGRKPRRGQRFYVLVFLVRAIETLLRRTGLMFREPVWWVRVDASRYDLVHVHLFALRQIGRVVPVVSSAGYPLGELYRERDRWSRWRCRAAEALERIYAVAGDVHVPWLHPHRGPSHMTVYSQSFSHWLQQRGVSAGKVSVVGTTLEPRPLRERPSSTRTVAFVGRAFEAKGGPVAMEAFALLRRQEPRAAMVVVTDEETANSLELVEGVTVMSGVEREYVTEELLPSIDVLLAPTSADCGVPYVLLEALRAGTCVVASQLKWLDEDLAGPGVRRVQAAARPVSDAVLDLWADLPTEQRGARALFEARYSTKVWHRRDLLPAYRAAIGGPDGGGTLVVASRRDVRRNPYDGFAVRHRSLLDHLAARERVVLAVIDDDSPDDLVAPPGVEVVRLPALPPPSGRVERLRAAARTAAGRPLAHDASWAEVVTASGCDRALTIGPWIQSGYRPVWRRLPTVHLFEEELQRVAALAPQSPQARALRRVEWALEAVSPARPAHVVAISEPETSHAGKRFPGVPRSCVPFGLDRAEWPEFDTTATGDDVVVVGNFAEPRNADGLREVLHAAVTAEADLTFRVVSGPGLHPSLDPHHRDGLVVLEQDPDSVSDAYRRAWASLVPARTVTGQKTTILQAWACGVPVVATAESAATVSADHALVAGPDATTLVCALLRLRDDPDERRRLAAAGLEVVRQRHTTELQAASVVALLERCATGFVRRR